MGSSRPSQPPVKGLQRQRHSPQGATAFLINLYAVILVEVGVRASQSAQRAASATRDSGHAIGSKL